MTAHVGKETILVVDDEEKIRKLVSMVLRQAGFRIVTASSGQEALERAAAQPLDLIVLDYLLGEGKDGLQVMREIRQWSDVLIMFLSAKDADVDKIRALETGADDYVEKPFNVDELVARARTLLRRRPGLVTQQGKVQFDQIVIDLEDGSVTRGGESVVVSNTEWRLLQQLAANHDRVMTHEELLSAVWGPEFREDVQYLRVWMSRLRRKLEDDPAEPRYLKTVSGIGYVLELKAPEPPAEVPATAAGEP
jgi:two-component system, OmpR family, KDP operon response regulator KdpE